MPLMLLRRFQRAGHKPIAVVGGATGMIGDPSGKSEERNLLSVDVLRGTWLASRRRCADFSTSTPGTTQAMLVNNFDWISRFSYLEFLRDVGKNFPVNVMLAKESVRARLERDDAGMSYTEFSYMLLQAYDFVYLNEHTLRAASRRQRPMGEHHRGHRPGAADAQRAALWPHLSAVDQERRRARWGRPRVARFGFRRRGPALTSSTNTGSTWTTPMRGSACGFLRSCRTKRSRSWTGSAGRPGRRDSQRRLAEELTRMVHGDAGLATARGRRRFFRRGDQKLSDHNSARFLPTCRARSCRAARLSAKGSHHRCARRIGIGKKQKRRPPHDRARGSVCQQPADRFD